MKRLIPEVEGGILPNGFAILPIVLIDWDNGVTIGFAFTWFGIGFNWGGSFD